MRVTELDRSAWVSALMALPVEVLLSVTEELSRGWKVTPKAIPQSGLAPVKLRDSALGELFYLGEIPLSLAWIEVKTPEGIVVEGAARVMDDRMEVVEALALCDAILSAELPGWKLVTEMLEEGIEILNETIKERTQMLASTQVNFSLLNEAGG